MGLFPKGLDQLEEAADLERLPRNASKMYAISFDLDTNVLKQMYPNPSWENAYADIKRFLKKHGFSWQQGSVYFGGPSVNAVTCVTTVQALSQKYPWFKVAVSDLRMLRIEDLNDLSPVL
ncbi:MULTISPECIES: virulence factor [Luteibacter]|uniref:virulence factor n=1 Tax=Luteibacter TaxID=242605 RepID=UPI001EFBF55F|nr:MULTISPECIES: virulence factor [unclassified Luteibacter]